MSACVNLGLDGSGQPVGIDLAELLATRLLVQGNSGSGKSHLLRRLLEGSAGIVQQIVIDPEGDFTTLAGPFGHTVIDAAAFSMPELETIAGRVRAQRASAVLNLEGLEVDDQMRAAAAFLSALFEAPREQWYPALVVVDEAQLFAPAAAGEAADDTRRASLAAMTNLMCRGRKRGLAGVIATQRLAKLAKNVAAEASNFLMGRTFLDIDMARAADLLGMERRQAEAIRDLERGQFLGLGPAVARRPVLVRVGAVETGANNAMPALLALPEAGQADLFGNLAEPPPRPSRAKSRNAQALDLNRPSRAQSRDAQDPDPDRPSRAKSRDAPALERVSTQFIQSTAAGGVEGLDMDGLGVSPVSIPSLPTLSPEDHATRLDILIANIAAVFSGQPLPTLYGDFSIGCRMAALSPVPDLPEFRRLLAFALEGIENAEGWHEPLALAATLPDEMLAPFLAIAHAARGSVSCPSDADLARIYGTASPGRVRRMLAHMEDKGVIVTRTDLAGNRTVALPHLGWTTAPIEADRAA